MKRVLCLLSAALLCSTAAYAQAPAAAAPQKIGLATAMQRAYAGIKLNITEAADKMSDADYSYRPSPEIRPYGGQFGHVAGYHYVICSAARGEANPMQGIDLEKKPTNKAEFVKALADSYTYCDAAFAALTDANVLEFVKQGQNEVTRAGLLNAILTHDNEEYGVVTVYLRTKALVPPSTERNMRGRMGAPAAPAPAR